ncbi:MAG: cation:proton antiporter [Caulobacteraceae bacterium]|nr:cation:proton antiporter [Caulobacteraceae bacterium]
MAGEVAASDYKDLVVFLATAGVVVPLFQRLKISPVLGFLAAGVALGPDGFGRLSDEVSWLRFLTIDDPKQIRGLGEIGVAFLLFTIGLELSWDRLKAMRKLVFGFGLLQVALCSAALAGVAMLLGQPPLAATVIGMALALSSTAVVMPVLGERNKVNSGMGRATFSVLLAQDLAVAPILVTVAVLAAGAAGGSWTPGLLALLPAAAGLGLLVLAGRLVLRPIFRSVARSNNNELFTAACLFVVFAASLSAAVAGLSMGLGALVAGVLLAETEYRREVEHTIEPFKGLLLGVFFVSVGAQLDLDVVFSSPLTVFLLLLGVILIKAAAVFGLARAFRLPPRTAIETAMVLGPAGEFAFVIVDAAMGHRLVDPVFAQAVLVAATVGLFFIPLVVWLADRVGRRVPKGDLPAMLNPAMEPAGERVLIVGYGRVGRLVGRMLKRHEVGFVAVDTDARLVSERRGRGEEMWYGDAARPEFLKLCGIETVPAIVVTMDAPGKVEEVVRTARALRPDLIIVARARDSHHAAKLYRLGATDAVPETTEAALQLAENTLVDLGVPMGFVIASVHEQREEFRKIIQDSAKRPTRALRRGSRAERDAELEAAASPDAAV